MFHFWYKGISSFQDNSPTDSKQMLGRTLWNHINATKADFKWETAGTRRVWHGIRFLYFHEFKPSTGCNQPHREQLKAPRNPRTGFRCSLCTEALVRCSLGIVVSCCWICHSIIMKCLFPPGNTHVMKTTLAYIITVLFGEIWLDEVMKQGLGC